MNQYAKRLVQTSFRSNVIARHTDTPEELLYLHHWSGRQIDPVFLRLKSPILQTLIRDCSELVRKRNVQNRHTFSSEHVRLVFPTRSPSRRTSLCRGSSSAYMSASVACVDQNRKSAVTFTTDPQ